MEEIAAFPLILLERKASSRLYLEQYFQQHGVTIQPEIELGSHNLLISLARIGLGVACVTEEFSQSGLGRGVILPLRTDFSIPPRAVTMCTLQGVTPTSAAKRFMDFISESNKMAIRITLPTDNQVCFQRNVHQKLWWTFLIGCRASR